MNLRLIAMVGVVALASGLTAQDESSAFGTEREGYGLEYEASIFDALDERLPVPRRVRHIDELGRFGKAPLARHLSQALKDESAPIRIATMRALMRLGVDPARSELQQLARAKNTSTAERAWAVRALGRSRHPDAVMQDLMQAVASPQRAVRLAGVESLRRVTGLTQGARSTLFFAPTTESDAAAAAQRWQNWWKNNESLSPEHWRTSALKAELPIDRAAAARAIAAERQVQAIPDLLERLEVEGDPDRFPGAASGVREAIAQSLRSLTGRRIDYEPAFKGRKPDQAWIDQHQHAIKQWRDFYQDIMLTGASPDLALLQAPEAKSRADALRTLRHKPEIEAPLGRYLELLSDPSPQVAREAWKNLGQTLGVWWPFDPDADIELRELQIARWRVWFETYGHRPLEAVLTPFLDSGSGAMRWGMTGSPQAVSRAEKELDQSLAHIRSLAAAHIANRRLAVAPTLLLDRFNAELTACREVRATRSVDDGAVHSGLQRHLALALGAASATEAVDALMERLALGPDARALEMPQAAKGLLDDPGVRSACVSALGEIGKNAWQAHKPIREMLSPRREPSQRVRAQAAYAVARLELADGITDLVTALEGDPEPRVRIAAAEALGMLARSVERDIHDRAVQELTMAIKNVEKQPNKQVRDIIRYVYDQLYRR